MQRSTSAKSIRSGVKGLFTEYCSNSSIHGVQYFGRREQTWSEKFWWTVVLGLSVGCCAVLIRNIYQKWDQTPVIVTFAEKSTPVWQIPFPAVTICPQTKAEASQLNFTEEFEKLGNMSIEDRFTHNKTDTVVAMMQLCDPHFFGIFLGDIDIETNKTSNRSYFSLIADIALHLPETLGRCERNRERDDCFDVFTRSITEEGVCFTYNSLSEKELLRTEVLHQEHRYLFEEQASPHWSLAHGYSKDANIRSYPDRSFGSGFSSGLTVELLANEANIEYQCSGPLQGFKVLLHSPADFPHVSKKFVRVPLDQDVTFAVKPQIITTSSGLRDYSPERRLCFFDHERYLQFFRVYTQDNCELECLTNFTRQLCGCVRFSMLRTSETAVCETSQYDCMYRAEVILLEMDAMKNRNGEVSFRAKCNCLPACTSLHYDVETTQADFDMANWVRVPSQKWSSREKDEFKRIHYGRIGIYYKEAQFMTSKRSELYGWTDFIANCGGLLGLCMGVSLLSLVELMYYCLVRPFMMWRSSKGMTSKNGEEAPSSLVKHTGCFHKCVCMGECIPKNKRTKNKKSKYGNCSHGSPISFHSLQFA